MTSLNNVTSLNLPHLGDELIIMITITDSILELMVASHVRTRALKNMESSLIQSQFGHLLYQQIPSQLYIHLKNVVSAIS